MLETSNRDAKITFHSTCKMVPSHCLISVTYFVTPGVAPTVQALHLFKLFMILENNRRTVTTARRINKVNITQNNEDPLAVQCSLPAFTNIWKP